jgi:hypothetical protein
MRSRVECCETRKWNPELLGVAIPVHFLAIVTHALRYLSKNRVFDIQFKFICCEDEESGFSRNFPRVTPGGSLPWGNYTIPFRHTTADTIFLNSSSFRN